MANTSSAKKAIRSSESRRVINLRHRRALSEARKEVSKAIVKKDKKTAEKLLPKAYKEIDKAAKLNIIQKNTAARYKSKLVTKIKAI